MQETWIICRQSKKDPQHCEITGFAAGVYLVDTDRREADSRDWEVKSSSLLDDISSPDSSSTATHTVEFSFSLKLLRGLGPTRALLKTWRPFHAREDIADPDNEYVHLCNEKYDVCCCAIVKEFVPGLRLLSGGSFSKDDGTAATHKGSKDVEPELAWSDWSEESVDFSELGESGEE
ncbi:uncharacterized protein RCO7_01602 [Rhynchosporium graminicola]|uniref:Uncharacterized protein n=1 Tax=Rhynchosporium graminicola TaxID=2792576 RepID=A0A1E1LRR2_9HELO|nr:uncharacterized protein RCO7_01602 [Rhynchosporium commune]